MAGPVTPEPARGFSPRYRSGSRRARWAVALLVTAGFVALFSLVHQLGALGLIDRAVAGQLTVSQADEYDVTTALLALLQLAVLLATGVAFLAWLSRTVDNVPSLGGGVPSVTPRWSIGWWFVPIMNLYRPFLIVRDTYRRLAGSGETGSGMIVAWWVAWVANDLLGIIALTRPAPETLDALRTEVVSASFNDLLTMIAAVLAVVVVREVEGRAEARAAELAARAEAPPPRAELPPVDLPPV